MKRLLILVVLLIVALSIWASGTTEQTSAITKPAVMTTIRIMGYGGQDPAVVSRLLSEVIGKDLAAEGITVVYEPLEGDFNAVLYNALSAGTAADLFYIPVETAPGIIATGKVLPLNGLIDTSAFIPSLIASYTVDGKIYGIAKDFNTLALLYNKDIFDLAKVEYPNENDTWVTIADKARKISALGNGFYGMALPPGYDRFGAFAFAAGWKPFNEKGRTDLTDPNFLKAVQWYTGLVKEKAAVQPSDIGQGWGGGAFASEKVAMAFEGAWIIGFLRNEAPNIAYGATFLPKVDGGDRGNFLYTVAYGINSDSKNRDAAIKVLAALTSAKAQQFILEQGLAIPSRTTLADNPYFKQDSIEAFTNKIVFEGAAKGNVYGFSFGKAGTDWMRPINSLLTEVMSGSTDLTVAVSAAQKEMDSLLDRVK
jgi:multiple sugar transport system substrate-binding protein